MLCYVMLRASATLQLGSPIGLPGPCSTRQEVSAAAHCRARTDACCWEKQQQTDNNRLKISIGLNNHLNSGYI